MSGRGTSPGYKAARVQLEKLAYGLALHGPTEDTIALVKALVRSSLWLETRLLLRRHGLPEYDVNLLMGTHPQGCACWRCVRRLREWAKVHRRRLNNNAS
jgi:hypothetical protein